MNKIKPEDWEQVGNDFKAVGKDIDMAIQEEYRKEWADWMNAPLGEPQSINAKGIVK